MHMPPIVELDELEDLHAHVRLVHEAAGEWQMPEVPAFRIAAWQIDIGYVEEPVAVLGVELDATPSVEDFCAEGCDLPPLASAREKKAAWV